MKPPKVNLNIQTIVGALTIPLAWVINKMTDAAEIKLIRAMYKEFAETGRVEKTLTEDVRVVRDLVNNQKRAKAPARKPKSRGELKKGSNLESAPSIGRKTAAILNRVGLHTIEDLLSADPDELSANIDRSWLTSKSVRDWQDQARLACELPRLRGHDVQILVGGGIRSLAELAESKPEEVLANVIPFVESEDGQRVVKAGNEPDIEEVARWIEWAESAA